MIYQRRGMRRREGEEDKEMRYQVTGNHEVKGHRQEGRNVKWSGKVPGFRVRRRI